MRGRWFDPTTAHHSSRRVHPEWVGLLLEPLKLLEKAEALRSARAEPGRVPTPDLRAAALACAADAVWPAARFAADSGWRSRLPDLLVVDRTGLKVPARK